MPFLYVGARSSAQNEEFRSTASRRVLVGHHEVVITGRLIYAASQMSKAEAGEPLRPFLLRSPTQSPNPACPGHGA
eukprot:6454901-Amphidinium_carterae.5